MAIFHVNGHKDLDPRILLSSPPSPPQLIIRKFGYIFPTQTKTCSQTRPLDIDAPSDSKVPISTVSKRLMESWEVMKVNNLIKRTAAIIVRRIQAH